MRPRGVSYEWIARCIWLLFMVLFCKIKSFFIKFFSISFKGIPIHIVMEKYIRHIVNRTHSFFFVSRLLIPKLEEHVFKTLQGHINSTLSCNGQIISFIRIGCSYTIRTLFSTIYTFCKQFMAWMQVLLNIYNQGSIQLQIDEQ